MTQPFPRFRAHDSHNSYTNNRRVSLSHSTSTSTHRRSFSTNSDLSELSYSDMTYDVPPSATPLDDPSVFPDVEKRTKEGFLAYRTSTQRPFKNRYFVLTRNFLLGAASADARKLDKVFHLENATHVGLVDTNPQEFFLQIQQGAKTKKVMLRADTEDDAQMWLSHIRAATRLTIHDIYQFVEPIGVSDTGTRVWRARVLPSLERRRRTDTPKGDTLPPLEDEFVAIKMIEKSRIDKTNLRNEIITMKRLDHPCVVKLYDVFEDKQYLCLIMEYCAGGELYDVVASQDGGRDEAESCDVMHQIARGVRYLHSRSVVHRDLKPENILCVSRGNGRLAVKIADFGISKAVPDGFHSMQTPVGTLSYMAPEILRGELYDKRCDYWSLGVIMHALVVGYSPWWRARTPTEVQKMIVRGQVELDPSDWAHVSYDVQNLVKQLLNPDPADRATVDDILNLTWREIVSSSSYNRARKNLLNVAQDALKRRRASTEAFERSAELLRRLYHVRGQSIHELDRLIEPMNSWELEEATKSQETLLEGNPTRDRGLSTLSAFSTAMAEEDDSPRTPTLSDFPRLEFPDDDDEGYVSPLDGLA